MLLSRGFGTKWSKWIISLLVGTKTCININGNPTPYFICKRGLRQGDPISPLIFDFVTDSLCQMLQRGQELGLLQGLGPKLQHGYSILQFLYAGF